MDCDICGRVIYSTPSIHHGKWTCGTRKCNEAAHPDAAARAEKKKASAARARLNRKQRDAVLTDLGFSKVRGSVSGEIYWE
jgi:hypothetical protein